MPRSKAKILSRSESSEGYSSNDSSFNTISEQEKIMLQTVPVIQKKKGRTFPKEVQNRLKAWLFTNADNPYPTDQEKHYMAKVNGITVTQFTNWLINARRRYLPIKDTGAVHHRRRTRKPSLPQVREPKSDRRRCLDEARTWTEVDHDYVDFSNQYQISNEDSTTGILQSKAVLVPYFYQAVYKAVFNHRYQKRVMEQSRVLNYESFATSSPIPARTQERFIYSDGSLMGHSLSLVSPSSPVEDQLILSRFSEVFSPFDLLVETALVSDDLDQQEKQYMDC